jgi:hypothetical protein
MAGPSRTIPALAFLCGLLAVASPGSAAADSLGQTKSIGYVCGHGFEPGPIVNGHNRQPTPAEFEARTRELRMHSEGIADPIQGQAGACGAT